MVSVVSHSKYHLGSKILQHWFYVNTDQHSLFLIPIKLLYTANNNIAYRPNFTDFNNSSLAALFFNLEVVFPCLRNTNTAPACSVFSLEEDGLLGGKSLIRALDTGNHIRIFAGSPRVTTFGFGFAGCSTFARSCVPNDYKLSLVCLMPCSGST